MMLATDAAAQRGRAGPRLAPEKAEAAWKLEAEGVAGDLDLKKKQVTSLVEAYVAARKSQEEARTELRNEGGGGGEGRGRFQAFEDLNKKESEKLGAALKASLKEEQTTKAIVSLGAFDRTWDRYVHSLATFELKGKNLDAALGSIQAFCVESAKVFREGR